MAIDRPATILDPSYSSTTQAHAQRLSENEHQHPRPEVLELLIVPGRRFGMMRIYVEQFDPSVVPEDTERRKQLPY